MAEDLPTRRVQDHHRVRGVGGGAVVGVAGPHVHAPGRRVDRRGAPDRPAVVAGRHREGLPAQLPRGFVDGHDAASRAGLVVVGTRGADVDRAPPVGGAPEDVGAGLRRQHPLPAHVAGGQRERDQPRASHLCHRDEGHPAARRAGIDCRGPVDLLTNVARPAQRSGCRVEPEDRAEVRARHEHPPGHHRRAGEVAVGRVEAPGPLDGPDLGGRWALGAGAARIGQVVPEDRPVGGGRTGPEQGEGDAERNRPARHAAAALPDPRGANNRSHVASRPLPNRVTASMPNCTARLVHSQTGTESSRTHPCAPRRFNTV